MPTKIQRERTRQIAAERAAKGLPPKPNKAGIVIHAVEKLQNEDPEDQIEAAPSPQRPISGLRPPTIPDLAKIAAVEEEKNRQHTLAVNYEMWLQKQEQEKLILWLTPYGKLLLWNGLTARKDKDYVRDIFRDRYFTLPTMDIFDDPNFEDAPTIARRQRDPNSLDKTEELVAEGVSGGKKPASPFGEREFEIRQCFERPSLKHIDFRMGLWSKKEFPAYEVPELPDEPFSPLPPIHVPKQGRRPDGSLINSIAVRPGEGSGSFAGFNYRLSDEELNDNWPCIGVVFPSAARESDGEDYFNMMHGEILSRIKRKLGRR